MSGTLIINGVSVKPPRDFAVGLNTIDSDTSGRNAKGKMKRDIIDQKVKLELKWGPLSDTEISTILKSVKGKFFTVNYPDPEEGKQLTKSFYVGDRTAPAYSWNEKFKSIKWEGLSMNFIEE